MADDAAAFPSSQHYLAMGASCRGRVHQPTTSGAGKLKLRATVGANRFPLTHTLAASRTQGLPTMFTSIVAQSDGAAATGALGGNLHRFVASGAAATGAIILFGLQRGMALTTHRHLAGGAECLRRVKTGTAGGTGDDINRLFAAEEGVQNAHGGTVANRIIAAATVTRHLFWIEFTPTVGTVSREQGVTMGANGRPGNQISLTQRANEIKSAAAVGANIIIFVGQLAAMRAKVGLAGFAIPIFTINGHPTSRTNCVEWLRL